MKFGCVLLNLQEVAMQSCQPDGRYCEEPHQCEYNQSVPPRDCIRLLSSAYII